MNHPRLMDLCCVIAFACNSVFAQQQSPEQLQTLQREKLEPLSRMNGVWRGRAGSSCQAGTRPTSFKRNEWVPCLMAR